MTEHIAALIAGILYVATSARMRRDCVQPLAVQVVEARRWLYHTTMLAAHRAGWSARPEVWN